MKEEEQRQKDIVDSLNRGTSTLEELSQRYGISKQGISHIYYTSTNAPDGTLRQIRKERLSKEKDNRLKNIKFVCQGCKKPVSFEDGKYLHKYCRDCHKLTQYKRRDVTVTNMCSVCHKPYHPFVNANKEKRSIGYFCSRDCYSKSPIKPRRPKKTPQTS